ncbi:MAG: hypothetical protein ACPGUD_14800 [Parashewanella sp.]
MIIFVYGLFGFVYAVITAPVFNIGPCNTNTGCFSGLDPPLRPSETVKHKPLGIGLSMGKFTELSAN